VPFIASSALVLVGLYVRLRIQETPAFRQAMENDERVRVPMATLFRAHATTLVLGTFAAVSVFVVFYLMTVFALSWGTSELHYTRNDFLMLQLIGMLFFGIAIPVAAKLADRSNPRIVLIWASAAMALYGLVFAPLLQAGHSGSVLLCLSLGLTVMGLGYGPLGSALAVLFPTAVRYTGASLTFNLAGIIGASLTPYAATRLATRFGLQAVGWYLTAAGVLTLIALLLIGRGRMTQR